MITPLYPIANAPATITVVAPGASAGDELIPVAPLTIALPLGYVIEFGSGKFAKLAAAADVDDEELDTAALPLDITTGLTATIPGSPASAILHQEFVKYTAEKQLATHLMAEMLLDLRAPAYTCDAADELAFAVVLQINFLVERKLTPTIMKSVSNTVPGNTTAYRDRWINPDAAAIVARVTGRRAVRFEPFAPGV